MANSSGMPRTPVLIVGGGPVGLCLALFLDHWGVECTIINAGESVRQFPKGNSENCRTMEHLRQVGISDEVRKLFPADHNYDQAYFTRLNAWEIHRVFNPSWNERKKMRKDMPIDDQFPEPMFHTNQMYLESLLFSKVQASMNVNCYFGWEAVAISQEDQLVHVITKRVSDQSQQKEFVADYVADCGGARSFIRQHLGIKYKGDTQSGDQAHWAGDFYNVWMRIPDLYPKCVGYRKSWFYWAVNSDPSTRSCLISLNGKDEFMLMVKPKGGNEVTAEEIKRWMRATIGEDMEVEVMGFAPWKAGAAFTAERYTTGRIFELGDAAHLFTPVGAFGMNTGIDDAHNLAWKLAAVFQGWGGPQLLDSYEKERRTVGLRNTGAARMYSSQMPDVDIPLEHLEEDSPEGEDTRKRASEAAYVRKNHFNKTPSVDGMGVQLGARYDDSPVILRDVEPPVDHFPDTYDRYIPSGIPGGRAPHVWLEHREREYGASLYDQLSRNGFTLLRIMKSGYDVSAFEGCAKSLGVPFKVLDLEGEVGIIARKLYEKNLALIRPDQHICWRGDTLPSDCHTVLKHVCGLSNV